MTLRRFSAAACAALLSISAQRALPARAQNDAAAAAATTSNSQMPMPPNVVKPFVNWIVRCYPVATPVPCEMFQISTLRQTKQRMVSILIAYMPAGDRNLMQIALPVGVDLQKGLRIRSSTYNSPAMPYRRCDAQGCYVETIIGNDAIAALMRAAPKATIEVAGFRGKTVPLPFSLDGFKDAHDALVALATQKATAMPPQPPPGVSPQQ